MKLSYFVFAALFLFTIAGASAALTDGLLGYYSFDTNWNVNNFTTGPGYNFASTAGTIGSTNCKFGNCLVLNGAQGVGTNNLSAAMTNSLSAGTIAFFLNTDSTAVQYNVFSKGAAVDRSQVLTNGTANTTYFQTNSNLTQTTISESTASTFLIVYTWNSAERAIWHNTTKIASSAGTYSFSASGNLGFGTNGVNANERLSGSIDNLYIFNRVLNSTEIQCIYENNFTEAITCAQSFTLSITATDLYDSSAINTFNASVTFNGNTTDYTTTNGTINTPYVVNSSQAANITVSATDYFPATYSNYNTTSLNAELYQAIVGFTASEIISDNAVTDFTVCASGGGCNTSTSPSLYLTAGTNNITFNKTGWFDKTFDINVTAVTSTNYEIEEVHQYLLNITLNNAFNGSSVSDFSATITSGDYVYSITGSTSNGSLFIPWSSDNNAEVFVFNSTLANTTVTFNTTGSTPSIVNISVSSFLQNTVQFYIRNANTGALIAQATNITLSGLISSYNLNTSNGTLLAQSLNQDFYFVTVTSNGYPVTQILLTTAGDYQEVTIYLDEQSQSASFSVLDTFNNPVYNATVTFYRSFNGSYQTVGQVLTDISGTFSINLNPNVRYFLTSVATGYQVYTGEIQPSQPQTYIIRMELPEETPGSSVLGNLFYSTVFTYNNNTPTFILFDYEVNSLVGDLDYFWANTSYLGTDYFTNVSGIPGGGVIQFNITGFDLTVENEFNVTIAFKRTGFDELVIVVPFYIEYYEPNQYSAYTGLFNLPVGVAGKAIVGTIILLIAIAGMWSISSSSEATMITGMVLTGLFSVPAIGLFPVVYGIITVSVLGIILIGDATVNR